MIEVDARGMRCPWPVLRLASAMRNGGAVLLAADDPAAAGEVAALCTERGWTCVRSPQDPTLFEVRNG